MKIFEILNTNTTLTVVKDNGKSYRARAKFGGREIEFRMDRWPDDSKWNFTFVQLGDGEDDEDDDRYNEDGETYDATGDGDQLAIFAAAKKFLEDALKMLKPSVVFFEADKTKGPSRAKLYNRFIKRWKLNGYTYRKVDGDAFADYHAFIEDEYYKETQEC
jgi:hypothetical protein